MRPARFQTWLLDALKASGATARIETESKYPYGHLITVGPGGETQWHTVGQLADGERHDDADTPVEGDPAAWTDAGPDAGPDAWLAAVIGRAESPEIARIERWSARDGEKRQGLTIHFHNGARAYVRKI